VCHDPEPSQRPRELERPRVGALELRDRDSRPHEEHPLLPLHVLVDVHWRVALLHQPVARGRQPVIGQACDPLADQAQREQQPGVDGARQCR
jgi:hypothetical protein